MSMDDYKVVPIRLSPDHKHFHHAYIREHFIKQVDVDKPRGRTLFILNVPPYANAKHLRTFFSKCGEIESVAFAEKPGREHDATENKFQEPPLFSVVRQPYMFKVAFVVFKHTESIKKALKTKSIDLFDDQGKSYVSSGIDKWRKEYNKTILDPTKTQQKIDNYMNDYDKRKKKQQMAEQTSAADDDGWITVGKHGHYSGFEQKESVINRIQDKMEHTKKKKELKNFYTFQIRESKMQDIVSLRKKFEEDKKAIEVMKKRRRFRPF